MPMWILLLLSVLLISNVLGTHFPRQPLNRRAGHKPALSVALPEHLPGAQVGDYILGNVIGFGSYAAVYEATKSGSSQLFALKVFSFEYLHMRKKTRKIIEREISILRTLKHVNIVRYFHSFQTEDYACIVLERCEPLTLMGIIKERAPLSEIHSRLILKHVVSGVKYLHEKSVIHRDLKPNNILLCPGGVLKIADFGISKQLEDGELVEGIVGSNYFIAPEIWENSPYSFPVDIYSLGVLLYRMLAGTHPYNGRTAEEVRGKVLAGVGPDFPSEMVISDEAQDLIRSMLWREPEERITIEGILGHPWMTQVLRHVVDIAL